MIKHFLADGREVVDITGHRVPINDRTIHAYDILVKGANNDKTNDIIETHHNHTHHWTVRLVDHSSNS